MSLRFRLLAGLLAVAAAGLAAFGVVSYRSLDSYLTERVDDQLRAAIDPVTVALAGDRAPPEPPQRGGPSAGPPPETVLPPPGGGGPGEVGGPPPIALPPGTYGQLRDEDGSVVDEVLFSYGGDAVPTPVLPARLPAAAGPGELRFTTVAAAGGDTGFRVAAVAGPGGAGTIVTAVPLSETQSTLDRLATAELLVALGVLFVLAFLGWWVIRLGLRPLDRMGRTADAIAAGDLSRRVEPANTATEVGRLGSALNTMLERIEAAFAERRESEQRMRRFLADASHELRTPLASLRGYSELFRLGMAERPEDTEKAMLRIEEEATRMGILVDDLLTLARLDEVREPVREPVDLTAVLERVLEDARVAAPGRPISLRAPGAASISGDPEQIHRVFANLLANALAHTPAGTPVEVDLAVEDGRVRVTVRDHGAGLGDGDPRRLFQRFWRDSSSRDRARGGTGLGLAIVAAIAEAHGGSVQAANAPGGGAAFTVDLPGKLTSS